MIKSMTGYGQGSYVVDGREYTVDIRAINHRYSDITIKMPRYLNFLEENVRKYVLETINRGKIEVYISLKNIGEKGRAIKADKVLAGMYINELREVSKDYDIPDDLTTTSLMRVPDLFVIEDESMKDLYWDELKNAVQIAIDNIELARTNEGQRLSSDILNRLNIIAEHVNVVKDLSSKLLEEYKIKLENRIKELGANDIIDESRLGVEVVLFADKSSICEEITRVNSHIDAFREMLNANGPIGKKLDFLVQEMNRETNTIGSKANSIGITKYVIEMKNEIENIREQIQNIE